MEKIVYSEEIVFFLNELIDVLFAKEYFGFKDSSRLYVQNIKEDIEQHIATKKHLKSPKQLLKYGAYYATFKGSRKTMWYVFFDKKDDLYYIEYITNNHAAEAAFLRIID